MHEGLWLISVCVATFEAAFFGVCLPYSSTLFTLSLVVVYLCRLHLLDIALTVSCVSYADNYGCNEHIDATNCSGASGQPEPSGLHPRCCLTA